MVALRLIGYARRNCPPDRGGAESLRTQVERMRVWCRENGHDLLAVLHEDAPGVSIAGRPVLKAILRTVVKDSTADGLLVTRINRLSRSELDSHLIKKSFDGAGKFIVACDDMVDTRESSRDPQFSLMVTVAAHDIGDRFFMPSGISAQAIVPEPPYGWKLDGRGGFVRSEREQRTLRTIERLSASGLESERIAETLNQQGVLTRNGRFWSSAKIDGIMR